MLSLNSSKTWAALQVVQQNSRHFDLKCTHGIRCVNTNPQACVDSVGSCQWTHLFFFFFFFFCPAWRLGATCSLLAGYGQLSLTALMESTLLLSDRSTTATKAKTSPTTRGTWWSPEEWRSPSLSPPWLLRSPLVSGPPLLFFIVTVTVAFLSACTRLFPRHWRSHHVGIRLRRGAHLTVP